jgi:hypothetical protein
LGFVCSNNGEKVVLFQERASGRIRKEVGAAANAVVDEEIASLFLAKFFERIGPKDIAHKTVGRGFAETINLSF